MTDQFKALVVRLRPLLTEARSMKSAIESSQSSSPVDARFLGPRLDRWIVALEGVIDDADRKVTATIPIEDLNSSNDE